MSVFRNITSRTVTGALLPLVFVPLTGVASQDTTGGVAPVGSAELLSVLGGLTSVIAAILLASFLYSKMKGPRTGRNNVINIIASQALGPKERVVLIEIANTQLVVGLTTSHVQTLHVFDEPAIKAAEEAPNSGFAERFRLALRGDR